MKQLKKSKTQRMISGVCGGIAEYFDMDVTLVRLITVVVSLISGVGILAYIAAMIVVPEDTDDGVSDGEYRDL